MPEPFRFSLTHAKTEPATLISLHVSDESEATQAHRQSRTIELIAQQFRFCVGLQGSTMQARILDKQIAGNSSRKSLCPFAGLRNVIRKIAQRRLCCMRKAPDPVQTGGYRTMLRTKLEARPQSRAFQIFIFSFGNVAIQIAP